MGTASTMQIMAEALGLMLPGTALMPATAPELKQAAYDAGKQLMELVKKGITAKDIVTKKSFENAIMVHAAISGSTNATMHLPAIAHDGVTMGQRVVDAVMTLCDAVAHISGKIAGSLAAVVVDRLHGFLDELIQMGAAGVAVAEGAFHHDLGLGKILDLPAHTHLQRVILRC